MGPRRRPPPPLLPAFPNSSPLGQVESKLIALGASPARTLFTGHSYGAAMATLSAFYYCPAEVGKKKNNTTKKEKICAASNLSLYQWPRSQHSTIAPPRLGKRRRIPHKKKIICAASNLSLYHPLLGPIPQKKKKNCAASNLSLYHPLLGPTPSPFSTRISKKCLRNVPISVCNELTNERTN